MGNKEIPALEKLSNGVKVVNLNINYSCPYCKKDMICEYNFDDSQNYIVCLDCKKVFNLILKEVNKKLNKFEEMNG